MSEMKYWKCTAEECNEDKIFNYKGLCRGCTEYDKNGNVVNPVHRVRVSQNGTIIVKPEKVVGRPVTLQDFKSFRRSQKRLSKKQMKALEVAHKAHNAQLNEAEHAHTCGDDCDHEHNHAEVMPIGESVGEEE